MARIMAMCAVWPWPWKYDIGSRSLESWATIVWNIIPFQHKCRESWPGHWFYLCVHCYLDLGYMSIGQGHGTPLNHGQQLWNVKYYPNHTLGSLSKSNMIVRSYGPNTNFPYVCIVTFTLMVWLLVKVMTYPMVIDNNCVKYYPNLIL